MRRLWLLLLLPLVSLLTGCANGLFYFPSHKLAPDPLLDSLHVEDVYFKSGDGTLLHGEFLHATGLARATIVHFHGNAENLSTHVRYVDWLPAQGYNVLEFDYRGYGLSAGSPSREGVYQDSLAAVRYAESRSDVDRHALFLLGQSLGAAQAITVAGSGQFPELKGVIAESGFSSYTRIAREKVLGIPVLGWLIWPFTPLLVSDGHAPEDVVGKIAPIPLLLIHGRLDPVVPYSHADRLYDAASSPKLLWTIEEGGHTESFGRFRPTAGPRLLKFLDYALTGNVNALDPADRSAAGLLPR